MEMINQRISDARASLPVTHHPLNIAQVTALHKPCRTLSAPLANCALIGNMSQLDAFILAKKHHRMLTSNRATTHDSKTDITFFA